MTFIDNIIYSNSDTGVNSRHAYKGSDTLSMSSQFTNEERTSYSLGWSYQGHPVTSFIPRTQGALVNPVHIALCVRICICKIYAQDR